MKYVNPRILYLGLDPSALIEQLIAPLELHLLIGVVSIQFNASLMCLQDFHNVKIFPSKLQHGYKEALINVKNMFLSTQEGALKINKILCPKRVGCLC